MARPRKDISQCDVYGRADNFRSVFLFGEIKNLATECVCILSEICYDLDKLYGLPGREVPGKRGKRNE